MATMKRLAILLRNEKVDTVIAAFRESNLEATIYDVKSAGKVKSQAKSGRGMSNIDVAYVPRKIIATVVESSKVQDTVALVKKIVGGESKGAIIVSSVDDFIPF